MSIIWAICGVKNSGKTTLIEKMIPILEKKGIKTAVIKHDGHDFCPDVPRSDSFRFQEAGAWGTAIYSAYRHQIIIKDKEEISLDILLNHFQEANLILLEGFKNSDYPKIEVIRKINSKEVVANPKSLRAIVTDLEMDSDNMQKHRKKFPNLRIFSFDEVEEIVEWMCMQKESKKLFGMEY